MDIMNTSTPMPQWVRKIAPDSGGAPPPPLPEEPDYPRRKPEKPDNTFLFVIAGLAIGATLLKLVINHLEKQPHGIQHD
jgi:hypothetical protein